MRRESEYREALRERNEARRERNEARQALDRIEREEGALRAEIAGLEAEVERWKTAATENGYEVERLSREKRDLREYAEERDREVARMQRDLNTENEGASLLARSLAKENEGLREKLEWETANHDEVLDENERLRQRIIEAETQPALSQRIKELEAEVKRLRAQNDKYDERWRVDQAEVDRLRSGQWTDEERKLFLFEATKASYAEGTRAGCEELSIEAAKMSEELEAAEAEVERLAAENRQLRRRV
jgi:chromosome segregation ATPase